MKVLLCRFQGWLGPVNMLTADGSSETALFIHLSEDVFRRKKNRKYLSYEANLFFQMVQSFR